MSTPADQRLRQLFADKLQFRNLESDKVKAASVCDSASEIGTSNSIASSKPDGVPGSQISTPGITNKVGGASSDDSDDYAAAFIQRPSMKKEPTKPAKTSDMRSLQNINDNHPESLRAIEFIPEGKKSFVEMEKKINVPDSEDDQERRLYPNNTPTVVARYCPANLVAKFPYKYMNDPSDQVSKSFFAGGKFYERTWDLYYVHPPQSFDKQALLLLPFDQVQDLVDQIALAFNIQLLVPPFPFTLEFYDDPTPKPVYLGTSDSRQMFKDLTDRVPCAELDHGECPSDASEGTRKSFEMYDRKVEKALVASKGKSSKSSHSKTNKLLRTTLESRSQLKRSQRYLGLRPRTTLIDTSSTTSWEDEKIHADTQRKARGLFIPFLQVQQPVPHLFDYDPVIIAIDVESYERCHDYITEIGISTLDTIDLVDLNPGPAGENWIQQIRSRHFRIKGREHIVNTRYCVGNPDAFRYGRSEFVPLSDIADAVDSCFEWPFSAQFRRGSPLDADAVSSESAPPASSNDSGKHSGPRQRNVILLGHDVGNDLEYLQKLGSEIFNPFAVRDACRTRSSKGNRHMILASVVETLDTAILYKTLKGETQPRRLSFICGEMGIEVWSAHNAGNDARYTLEAMVKIVIQARLNEDEAQRKSDTASEGIVEDEWEVKQMHHVDQQMELARRKIRKKLNKWHETNMPGAECAISGIVTDGVDDNDVDGDDIDWSIPLGSRWKMKIPESKEPNSES